MKILKRENWWIWLLIFFFSQGSSTFILGALLDVYDKDAWYAKWYYWVIGLLLFALPFSVMIIVFTLQILCKVSAKLEVPHKDLYLSPYVWIFLLIIPILGWIVFVILMIYLEIMIFVQLHKGNAEKYID